jgi:hypothetical protein
VEGDAVVAVAMGSAQLMLNKLWTFLFIRKFRLARKKKSAE